VGLGYNSPARPGRSHLHPLPQPSQSPAKTLYQDLFSKNQQIKLHGDHYIACPEDWFSKVLEKLYGGPVGL
jgi:hypothetical protein